MYTKERSVKIKTNLAATEKTKTYELRYLEVCVVCVSFQFVCVRPFDSGCVKEGHGWQGYLEKGDERNFLFLEQAQSSRQRCVGGAG